MLKVRVIPVILWDGKNFVLQTVGFQRPARVFGSLMDAVRVYENRNVDEVILLDIEATRERRAPNFSAIEDFIGGMFCPVTYGGGIRSIDDVGRIISKCGADKVAIRSAATPEFISAASRKFGAQAIVFALNYDVHFHPLWTTITKAQQAEEAGAGEILLTSTARNGTMTGYDLELIRHVGGHLTIPVIAHGGCRTPADMLSAIDAWAHAVAASTMFLFTETTPRECAQYLVDHGVPARVT